MLAIRRLEQLPASKERGAQARDPQAGGPAAGGALRLCPAGTGMVPEGSVRACNHGCTRSSPDTLNKKCWNPLNSPKRYVGIFHPLDQVM